MAKVCLLLIMLYLWASRPRIHASVCICVHQAQEILSPRYLAKTFLFVTKCQPCVKLCKVCAKLCSVVIAWLVACYECCRIDVLKNSTSMIGCVPKLKYLDLGLRDHIKLLVTIVLIECLMASHEWWDSLKSIELYPSPISHPRASYIEKSSLPWK